jgi:hypothetical protein
MNRVRNTVLPTRMNRLLNALDVLYDAVKEKESDSHAVRIRRFLIDLLHKEERNLNHADPNSPFTRFATSGDSEGNRLRLFQALQECCDEENSDLQAVVELMFEVPGETVYAKINDVLRRYMAYADQERDSDSDSDTSSDDSD